LKIYTRTGDDGTTGLLGPGRHAKDSPRVDAYGQVDELNAALGVARATGLPESVDGLASAIQHDLFALGAALADPDPAGRFHGAIGVERVAALERAIDDHEAALPPLTQFILPGGTPGAAALHLARTVCRRAERAVVALASLDSEHVPPEIVAYLNRLGDLLFVLARAANRESGVADVPWRGA
jgi:cob(I)alamin adenosyltransferase